MFEKFHWILRFFELSCFWIAVPRIGSASMKRLETMRGYKSILFMNLPSMAACSFGFGMFSPESGSNALAAISR